MTDPTGVPIAVPADLESSGPTIVGIANAIDDELTRLKALLTPLQDYWTGGGHDAWRPLQDQWDTAANDLMGTSGALGAMGTTANTNWNNYVDCETSNMRTWAHH